MQNEISTLVVYDLDDTLFKTPGPYCYRMAKRILGPDAVPNIKNLNDQYIAWWDHPVSLNTDIFDIPSIGEIVDIYRQTKRDTPTAFHALITHRDDSLMPQILNLLNINGIVMDKVYANKRSVPKSVYLMELLDNLPNVQQLIICEDSMKHIRDYHDAMQKRGKKFFVMNYIHVGIPMIYVMDERMKVIDDGVPMTLKFTTT